MVTSVSAVINACQVAGSPNIIAFVRSWLRLGPPSTRYDASVKGAPANPMSGTSPNADTSSFTASAIGVDVFGLERLHGRDVGLSANRVRDDGTDVGHDVQVDARRTQRHDDVGEQDGCVHAVPAHRLQGDLADQRRVEAGLQHAVVGAQRPVLGQRASSLAHEPDRDAAGLAAAGRGEIWRLRQVAAGIHRHPCCHEPRGRGLSRES